MKDKVDVLQGVAGILWILLIFQTPFWLFIHFLICFVLSMIIVALREDEGIDLFGLLGVLIILLALLLALMDISIPELDKFIPTPISVVLSPPFIIGIGLILEAFDIIKPIKMS